MDREEKRSRQSKRQNTDIREYIYTYIYIYKIRSYITVCLCIKLFVMQMYIIICTQRRATNCNRECLPNDVYSANARMFFYR